MSFVYPFLTQRPNLSILVNHQTLRIIWDTVVRSNRLMAAVRVEFLPSTGGSSDSDGVVKEVISSASTIGVSLITCFIFQLTGISCRVHTFSRLAALGIERVFTAFPMNVR